MTRVVVVVVGVVVVVLYVFKMSKHCAASSLSRLEVGKGRQHFYGAFSSASTHTDTHFCALCLA